MPDRLEQHDLRPPKARKARSSGSFYPSEVARILEVGHLDYRQLRRLFLVVSLPRRDELPRERKKGKWARFSFEEIWRLRAAIELLGGPEAICTRSGGRLRLRLRPLEDACERLARDLRFVDGNGHLRIHRVGSEFVADIGDAWVAPKTRQLYFDEVVESTRRYLRRRAAKKSRGMKALRLRMDREMASTSDRWFEQGAGRSSRRDDKTPYPGAAGPTTRNRRRSASAAASL